MVGNTIAKAAMQLALDLQEHVARITIENPDGSYLWPFLRQAFPKARPHEVVLDQCRFGAEYKKPTRLWAFNCCPFDLARRCGRKPGSDKLLCGRPASIGHVRLAFGHADTHDAAVYPPALLP